MPISPADRAKYPANWPVVSLAVRERSGGRCECEGECGRNHQGRCGARNSMPAASGARVVLTTAHLWRGPCAEHAAREEKCGDPAHLKAMCQACHLAYDRPHHIRRAKATRRARRVNMELPLEQGDRAGSQEEQTRRG